MDVREKLVELIVSASHECDDFYDLLDMRQAVDSIADFLISHGVTVQEWISVKDEGKPKVEDDVLVAVFDGYDTYISTDCIMKHGDWCYNTGNYKVTHWSPLPQPPKGE